MKKRILVVDDEPDIVRTISMALELNGHVISTASTGSEALEKLDREDLDLVILDMFLPEISGKEVVRRIRSHKRHKDIPIISITALAQKSEKEEFEAEEIDFCMIKPFDLEELEEKVSELLKGSSGGV